MVKTTRKMIKRTRGLVNSAIDSIKSYCSMDLGVDLGTCTTVITISGEGIVLDEPSVIAVNRTTKAVANNGNAVGCAAREMLGKTPKSITTIRPLRNGVISDFEATEAMLSYFIRKVSAKKRFKLFKPRVVVAVPSCITDVERRAVIESIERTGARQVYLIDEPMAAGLGSGLPIASPTASMIVDLGGGTTDVAIMSLSDIASCESIRVGGDAMDRAIAEHIKKTYGLLIGEQRAEKLKKDIGSAAPLKTEMKAEVSGRDTVSGMPRKIDITSEEIRDAIRGPIAEMVEAVLVTLEKAEPELAADLIDNGIHICGGGSLLRGMDEVLQNATGLKVIKVEDPLNSVARGTDSYVKNLEHWKDLVNNYN